MKKFIKKASPAQKQNNLEKENTRALMQAFYGCRKNCAECKEDEKDWEDEWEPKIVQAEPKRWRIDKEVKHE